MPLQEALLSRGMDGSDYGSFHKQQYAKWMVDNGKSNSSGRFKVTPILGNHDMLKLVWDSVGLGADWALELQMSCNEALRITWQ